MAENFLPALDADALPPGKGETVELAGQRIAVFNVGGQFFALDDDCPHRGGPLGSGWVDADSCQVACPLHGWAFDLKTGTGVTVPARPVRSHPVRVEGGKVWVSVHPSAVSGQQAASGGNGIAEPGQSVHLPPPTAEGCSLTVEG